MLDNVLEKLHMLHCLIFSILQFDFAPEGPAAYQHFLGMQG